MAESEVGTLIVSCNLPTQLTKNWSASKLERVLGDCAVYVANAVALRYSISKLDMKLNVITDPADPGALFTLRIPMGNFSEVERYTRRMWEQARLEFA